MAENPCGDVYNQVASDPRPSWEYYPPSWQGRQEKQTIPSPGYIPHVLLIGNKGKEDLIKIRDYIDQLIKAYG